MYVKFSKEELSELSQYWYSKYCNEVCRPEKEVFYKLYLAYEDLIKFPNLETNEHDNE